LTFRLSRHSEGASRRKRVSMYPWIQAVRTQDTKSNAAWENIPKWASWLHPAFGRHPLNVALGARREGDGCAPVRQAIHQLVLGASIATSIAMTMDESTSGTIKLLPAGSPAAWLWNALQHTCRFRFQERI
jgi:hypothetical protein